MVAVNEYTSVAETVGDKLHDFRNLGFQLWRTCGCVIDRDAFVDKPTSLFKVVGYSGLAKDRKSE